MSSFRDPINPEAIHYPGSFAARSLLGVAAFASLMLLGAIWAADASGERLWSTAAVLAVLLLLLYAWPRKIITDQYGVWLCNLFGRRARSIPWADLESVTYVSEVPWPRRPRGGICATRAVVARSRSGRRAIVHGPRHADQARFLQELKRRGAVEV